MVCLYVWGARIPLLNANKIIVPGSQTAGGLDPDLLRARSTYMGNHQIITFFSKPSTTQHKTMTGGGLGLKSK